MNRIVRRIIVGLLFLLLPFTAFAGSLGGADTVEAALKGCSSCMHSRVESSECCRGTDSHAMGEASGHQTPVENGDCPHGGFCRQYEGEGAAIHSSTPADTGFPAGRPGIYDDYSLQAADIASPPLFLPPERLTAIYILHCAFLI